MSTRANSKRQKPIVKQTIPHDFYQWRGPESIIDSSDTTVMAFQNIRGLHTRDHPIEMAIQEIVSNMQEHNIFLLGVSEHHLAMTNHRWRQRLTAALNKTIPKRYAYQLDSAKEDDPLGRLVGGTGLLAREAITGRIQPNGQGGDNMGRWSYIHLRRSNQPPITVISVYQVCPFPTNVVGNTAWHQQRRYLDLHNRSEHPREAFCVDLMAFIKDLQKKQHSIVVGGDWNDWLGAPNSKLLKLCTDLHLVDPWITRCPQDIDFATYEHGQHRIDAVFVTEDLQSAITSIRYSPGSLLCSTDHRAVLLEFHTKTLFGNHIKPPLLPTARGIKSNDRQAVTLFIEKMYQHLQEHNAFNRGQRLEQGRASDSSLAESLDRLIGEAGNIGEAKCGRRRKEWYSNELAKTRFTVSLLRYHVNGLKANIDRSVSIQSRLHRIQQILTLPVDLAGAKAMLQQFESKLQSMCSQSENIRKDELTAKANMAEDQGDDVKARAIRTINKSERHIQTWKTLKFMSNQGQTQQLDRIDIPSSWLDSDATIGTSAILEDPKQATNWTTVDDPIKIEHYLMLRNYQHFGQAHGTPFTIPPLSEWVDWTATSPASEAILIGTFTTDIGISDICKRLLHHCQNRTGNDTIPALLTEEEFRGKLRVWNERTTTSPSGRHLGRYKALYAKSIYPPESNDHETFLRKQESIRTLILQIINFCIATNYPLARWCRITNTMIFKEPGVYKIHKLRVIHLFEADLNLIYAVKWRQLVRHADESDALNPGQYGGRPGYEAQSMALLEELRIDASHLTRRTLLTFDNDAASCYDRIVINLASLVNRQNGLHQDLTRLHGKILQNTEYRLRTSTGLSNTAYQNRPDNPLYGTGQGAGNSPGIWLLISNLLFNVHDELSHGATFVTQNGKQQIHMGLSGFVDDTNTVTNCFHPNWEPPLDQILEKLRHDAQMWTDILYLSGGKLELAKCSYHILQFKFQPNGTPTVQQHQQQPPLELLDPTTNTLCQVPCLASSQAHKILGHWKSPADPKQSTQMKSLVAKANQTALLISASPLTREGALIAYRCKYIPSLKYVLPQCWFEHSRLQAGERYSMAKIIAKCGYGRTTPKALLYAPKEYAGAGFVHWYTLQSEGQIQQFIKHWRTTTTVSAMLRVTMSWAQWQAGIGECILTDVRTSLPHVEGRWLLSVRKALASANAFLQLDDTAIPPIERVGDQYIMEFAIQSGEFSPRELKAINYCRLYLHLTTISEMVDADGQSMLQHVFECHRPDWFDPSTVTVLQSQPSYHQRHYQWKRLCRMMCTEDLRLIESLHVGRWRCPASKLRLRREAYIQTHPSKQIYVWKNGSYWTAIPHSSHHQQYMLQEAVEWTPTEFSTPVTVRQHHSPRRCTIQIEPASYYTPPAQLSTPRDFDDYRLQLEPWEQELLQSIQWCKAPYEIIHLLYTDMTVATLLVVSDGGCIDCGKMSFGVVIGTESGTILMEAQGAAYGEPSSHRAECTGSLVGALLLHHLLRYTSSKLPAHVEILAFSDNQSMTTALKARQTYQTVYANATLKSDWELLEETHQTYSHLNPTKVEYKWIRGHQDQQPALFDVLPPEVQFHIRADQLAGGQLMEMSYRSHIRAQMTTTTKCLLYVDNKACTGNYMSAIRRAMAEADYKEYMMRRHKWTDTTYADVDWEAFYAAASRHDSISANLMKLIHDKLPTNKLKSKYSPSVGPTCHFCQQEDTFDHLCTTSCNPRSIAFRNSLKEEIMNYFKKTSTPKIFQERYLAAWTHWINLDATSDTTMNQHNETLSRSQTKIGWQQMFRGFLSKRWRRMLINAFQHERLKLWCTINEQGTVPPKEIEIGYRPMNHHERRMEKIHNVHRKLHPTKYLAGLINITWKHMGNLWQEHTRFIHDGPPLQSPVKRQELLHMIRTLHHARPKTMAAHQDRYFFADVEQYVTKASNLQMHRYIERYRPVILKSIQQAEKIATQAPKITQFFQSIRRSPRGQNNNPDNEEPKHRKHTRIRTPLTQKITAFFTKITTPAPPP